MADTVGNLLGPRARFLYTTDGGTSKNIVLDRSVGLAVGNEISTVDVDDLPASQKRPITPRYLLLVLESNPAVTKRAIICDPDNPLFARDGGTTVTINGVAFRLSGRVGEQRTFARPSPPEPPE